MQKSKKFLHDHLFKEVYSQTKYCVDILSLVLSKEEMKLFDWTTLKTEATTFIDKSAKEKRMDLLVSALLKSSQKPAKILFLMEHKSQHDLDLMIQFLIYQAGIYQNTRIPILPVLINQSTQKTWPGPLDFHEYLHNFPVELKERFAGNVLNFRPRVLNIQSLDVSKEARDLTTRPILYILKHIWRLDESKVKELFTIGQGLSSSEREALIGRAVDYIRRYDPAFNWDIVKEIEQATVKEEGRIMMPLLKSSYDEARQQGMQQGRLEGIQEGRLEGIQQGMQQGRQEGQKELIAKLLKTGVDLQALCKGTGLSEEEIKKLKSGD